MSISIREKLLLRAVWSAMIRRCENPMDDAYINYGARGIKVCNRWKNFEKFLQDMGDRPKGMQLDRRNNDGNYTKLNCRWVTRKVNSNNTRRNIRVTYKGKTRTLTQWCRILALEFEPIRVRIQDYGWSVKKSFRTPLKTYTKMPACYTVNGKTKSVKEWAAYSGIKLTTLRGRLNAQKLSIEDALSVPVRKWGR